jgi:hypothetical protein
MLLARIYEVLPLRYRRCGEPMRLIAFVTDSGSITRILAYLGEAATRSPPGEDPGTEGRAGKAPSLLFLPVPAPSLAQAHSHLATAYSPQD